MITIEEAIEIAIRCHKGQKDKSGKPYILHPIFVMSKMKTEKEMIVAVLHDVIEDYYNHQDSSKLLDFFNKIEDKEIIFALETLTRIDDEDYYVYINRIAKNIIATKVKIADLEHNMDLTRLNKIGKRDVIRFLKYKDCLEFLTSIKSYSYSIQLIEKEEKEDEDRKV